jgi:hypothetical protein
VFLDDLDRHVAMQDFVIGAIDDTHATFADLGGNAAVAENLADHEQAPFKTSFKVSWFQSFKVSKRRAGAF